jgi:hypothetical protein
MIWFMVMQVVSMLVELVRLGRRSEGEKDLEILLLRRQLAIYERRQERAPHLSRGEKLTLVVLATKLKAKTGRTIKGMGGVIRMVKPATVFGWHKELVRLKWTYRRRNPGGRPRTDREIERLVVRLARENGWGIERIEGELKKLGYTVSHETVGNILRHTTFRLRRTRDVAELASSDDPLQGAAAGSTFHRGRCFYDDLCPHVHRDWRSASISRGAARRTVHGWRNKPSTHVGLERPQANIGF